MVRRRVFLSYSFDHDRELAKLIQALVESVGDDLVTGEDLGGGPLTPAIQQRVREAQAFVAIVSPRPVDAENPRGASEWVLGEIDYARGLDTVPTLSAGGGVGSIVIVHRDVPAAHLGPMYQNHERMVYTPDQMVAPITKLMRTLSRWKEEAGRRIKLVLQPKDIGQPITGNYVVCKYRFIREGIPTEWREAPVFVDAGAPCVWVDGLRDDQSIEVQLQMGTQKWASDLAAQLVRVDLVQVNQ